MLKEIEKIPFPRTIYATIDGFIDLFEERKDTVLMLMDTDMIYYVLEGHELQNDVQTLIQVFLANRHYTRTEEVTDAEITVKSEFKKGIASAMLYRRGEKVSEWSMEYDEAATTEKDQKLRSQTHFQESFLDQQDSFLK